MSEPQIDPAWQKITITVEDPDGTVQRLDGDSWAVVAGQFTQGYTRRYPLAALERTQIVVLP